MEWDKIFEEFHKVKGNMTVGDMTRASILVQKFEKHLKENYNAPTKKEKPSTNKGGASDFCYCGHCKECNMW